MNKIFFVVFSGIIFYVIFIMIFDFKEIIKIYNTVDFSVIIVIIPILIIEIIGRTILQKFFLKQIGIELSFKKNFVLFLLGFTMVLTPMSSGQIIKSAFLKKEGYSIQKTLPLVLAERTYDLCAIFILISITILFVFSNESLIAVIILSILIVFLFLLIKNKKIYQKIIKQFLKIKLFKKIIPNDPEFLESLDKLFENKIIVIGIIVTFIITILESTIIFLGIQAFNVDIDYVRSVQIFYTSIVFGAISFIPAGIGVVESSFAALLIKEGVVASIAGSVTIFVRFTTIWFMVIAGFITLIFARYKKYWSL